LNLILTKANRLRLASAAPLALTLLLGGCLPNYGLSPRETRGNDYSTLIYEGLPLASTTRESSPIIPALPMKIGVIQAGEVAPPPSVLKILAAKTSLLSRVEALPGIYDGNDQQAPVLLFKPATQGVVTEADASQMNAAARRRAVDRMRALASSMGLDYLLLYGGTIDRNDSDTPLAIFNLTLVGLYLIPSREAHAQAHASAALIDVRTGRVIVLLDACSEAKCLVPYACTSNGLDGVTDAAREHAIDALAREFLCRLEQIRPAGG